MAGNALLAGLTNGVEIFDITNASEMMSVAARKFPEIFPNGPEELSSGHDLIYRCGHLYLTVQFDDNVGIIRVDDSRLRGLMDTGSR